ncbi:MAG: hypothetical protein ACKVPX_15630 [Myxococcaceae bacterium]
MGNPVSGFVKGVGRGAVGLVKGVGQGALASVDPRSTNALRAITGISVQRTDAPTPLRRWWCRGLVVTAASATALGAIGVLNGSSPENILFSIEGLVLMRTEAMAMFNGFTRAAFDAVGGEIAGRKPAGR